MKYPSEVLIFVVTVLGILAHAAPLADPVDPSLAPQGADGNSNPFKFPLTNGFPEVNETDTPQAISDIETNTLGTLLNTAPPPALADDDVTSFQLVAFNELWETSDPDTRELAINALVAVQAQEELHVLSANALVSSSNNPPIGACEYMSPATNLSQVFGLARTFTDVVLGTLANVPTHLAQNGDSGLISTVGSIIGQEGEQNGWYREQLNLVPSSLPFLTASARAFAFSALNQMFVVEGSCPNVDDIDLPIFLPLKVVTSPVEAMNQTLQFSLPSQPYQSAQGLSVVYINQQNYPVTANISDADYSNGALQFSAEFPYDEYEMNGLTIDRTV